MKTCIVTGCDRKYLPGVKALYTSIKRNGNTDADIVLLAHGRESDFVNLPADIKVILNQETCVSPTGGEWKREIPAMYSRVLIPRLLKEYDRALWLDADTIVLKDLNPLLEIDMEGYPCAACLPAPPKSPYNTLDYQFERPYLYPSHRNLKSLSAGVVLFDIAKWNDNGLNKRIIEILTENVRFKYVVQGLMGMAVEGKFLVLPPEWNTLINWVPLVGFENVNILHFVGGSKRSVWSHPMKWKQIWNEYQ